MSLPRMGKTLKRFEKPATLVSITQDIVGVQPVLTRTEHETKAVIQVASSEVLKAMNIDYSQGFYQVHIQTKYLDALAIDIKTIDEITNYKNRTFKIIDTGNFNEYGYFGFICEEVLI